MKTNDKQYVCDEDNQWMLIFDLTNECDKHFWGSQEYDEHM